MIHFITYEQIAGGLNQLWCSGKKYLKKISAKRLCINSCQKNAHSAWSTYSLGLQDADGAVKKESINLDVTVGAVDFAVDYSLHRKPDDELLNQFPVPPHADLAAHGKTCLQLFGYCKQQPHHDVVHAFVKSFANMVTEQKLSAGTLVKISFDCFPNSPPSLQPDDVFFLGVLNKKPLAHVVAHAWPLEQREGHFSLVRDASGLPVFTTTHKVFYNMIAARNGDVKSMTVLIFKSHLDSKLWGLHQLNVVTTGSPINIALRIGHAKQQSSARGRRANVSLPFNLQVESKKRKQRPKAKSKQHKKQTGGRKPHIFLAHGSDSCDSDANSDSNTSASPASCQPDPKPEASQADAFAALCDQDLDSGDAEAEASDPVPPTNAARDEAKEVNTVTKEYQEDCERKAELAEKALGSGAFFSKSIGFGDASIAPTGRSQCYHCSRGISKGDVRFTYNWNLKRPSRYVHASCIIPFVQADPAARKEQAINALSQVNESCANQLILDEAANILEELLNP